MVDCFRKEWEEYARGREGRDCFEDSVAACSSVIAMMRRRYKLYEDLAVTGRGNQYQRSYTVSDHEGLCFRMQLGSVTGVFIRDALANVNISRDGIVFTTFTSHCFDDSVYYSLFAHRLDDAGRVLSCCPVVFSHVDGHPMPHCLSIDKDSNTSTISFLADPEASNKNPHGEVHTFEYCPPPLVTVEEIRAMMKKLMQIFLAQIGLHQMWDNDAISN